MKNIIAIITLLFCMSILSCRKTQENKTITAGSQVTQPVNGNTNYQDIINKIKDRSDKYRQANGPGKDAHPLFWGALIKFVQVLVADVAGGVAADKAGGTTEEIILAGATCSALSAVSLVVPAGNGGTLTGGPTGGPANTSNPYDFAGYWHYKILDKGLKTPSLICLPPYTSVDMPLFYSFASNELVSNGVYSSISMSYPTFLSTTNYAINGLSTYATFPDFTQAMVSSSYMSVAEKQILDDYLDVMENAANSASPTATSSFITYSIIVEGDVMSSILPGNTKVYLLSVMSACRWGLAYWK